MTTLKFLSIAAALIAAPLMASAQQSWVGGTALNVRSGPGTGFARIATLSPCTPVQVTERQNGWARITGIGGSAWVSSAYLQGYACGEGPTLRAPIRREAPYSPSQRHSFPTTLRGVYSGA